MIAPMWHNDGHTMTLVIEDQGMHLEWGCPFRAADLLAVAWDARPHCRQRFDEDGQPERDDPPLDYCNVQEFIYADGAAQDLADLGRGTEVRPITGTFRIEYRWEWADETYLWRPVTGGAAS